MNMNASLFRKTHANRQTEYARAGPDPPPLRQVVPGGLEKETRHHREPNPKCIQFLQEENIMFNTNQIAAGNVTGRVLLVMVCWLSLTIPATAFAATAANSVISNTVTVNYEDGAGNAFPAQTDTATVTVTLVQGAPTLSSPADLSITTIVGDSVYTIDSGANGPDTYTLSSAVADVAGAPNVNTTVFRNATDSATINSIALGASSVYTGVTIPASPTITAVAVPADGSAGSEVNGIQAGDTVVVNGVAHTVDSVTDNASGTSTLNLVGAASANVVTAGMTIAERGSFIRRSTNDSNGTVDVTTTATDSGSNSNSDIVRIAYSVANVSVTKEVSTDGGASYAATANAASGSTLTYRVTVTNASATQAASNIVVTDLLDVNFVTYSVNSAKAGSTIGQTYAAAPTSLTDSNPADDGYDFGVTLANQVRYTVTSLAAGSSVVLYYQVSIK
jgi:uncharacterized repeat protein (TIGR01451 family)